MTSAARFGTPWTIHELVECFQVRDASGQPVPNVYFERDTNRLHMSRLTYDEARRVIMHIAELPDLLKGSE